MPYGQESYSQKLISRLIREARQDKYRTYGVMYDFENAEKIENDKFNIYVIVDEGEGEGDSIDYLYLIYDDNNIVSMRCNEKINDAQLNFIQGKFFSSVR